MELVEKAQRATNAYLGQNGMDPNELNKYRAQSYCLGLGNDPVILGLYNSSPLKDVVKPLIRVGKIKTVMGGQIALRSPSMNPPREPGPHIDGMYSPTNGVKEGTIGNFTALVGVFLSDLPEPYAGNFTVWPKTHTLYEQYFREHEPQALLDGMPRVTLPEPEQSLGKAGDAALVH